jgi:hypothetical protein
VLLLEPRKAMVIQSRETGETEHEVRAENAVGQGLQRLLPGVVVLDVARDWALRRSGPQVELIAPFGQLLARAEMRRFPPGWLAAADELGYVLVIYGTRIGMRTPPGARSYNDDDRRAELDGSRRAGAAAWGLVQWTGTTA